MAIPANPCQSFKPVKAVRVIIEEIGDDDRPKAIRTSFLTVPREHQRNSQIQALLAQASDKFCAAKVQRQKSMLFP